MINLTAGKAKVLQELKDYFNYSINSGIRQKWRMQCIAFKLTTGLDQHRLLAEYLNNMVYVIQSQNDFQNKSTQKCTDAFIGGFGWTHFGYEPNSYQTFFYDYNDANSETDIPIYPVPYHMFLVHGALYYFYFSNSIYGKNGIY